MIRVLDKRADFAMETLESRLCLSAVPGIGVSAHALPRTIDAALRHEASSPRAGERSGGPGGVGFAERAQRDSSVPAGIKAAAMAFITGNGEISAELRSALTPKQMAKLLAKRTEHFERTTPNTTPDVQPHDGTNTPAPLTETPPPAPEAEPASRSPEPSARAGRPAAMPPTPVQISASGRDHGSNSVAPEATVVEPLGSRQTADKTAALLSATAGTLISFAGCRLIESSAVAIAPAYVIAGTAPMSPVDPAAVLSNLASQAPGVVAEIAGSLVTSQRVFEFAALGAPFTLIADSVAAFIEDSASIPAAVVAQARASGPWMFTAGVIAADLFLLTYVHRRRRKKAADRNPAMTR